MDMFSLKGLDKLVEYSDWVEGSGAVLLRVDVNGESFFLTNDYKEEISLLAMGSGFGAEFTFSLHKNEVAIPVIIDPLKDFSTEFSKWVCSKLSLNVCSVKIAENNVLSYSQFLALVENRVAKEKALMEEYPHVSRISANPLV